MVVAAVWGTEFIKFLAALAILHQDDFEEYDEFIRFFKSYHPGAIHPFLQILFFKSSLCKIAIALHGIE